MEVVHTTGIVHIKFLLKKGLNNNISADSLASSKLRETSTLERERVELVAGGTQDETWKINRGRHNVKV